MTVSPNQPAFNDPLQQMPIARCLVLRTLAHERFGRVLCKLPYPAKRAFLPVIFYCPTEHIDGPIHEKLSSKIPGEPEPLISFSSLSQLTLAILLP